MLRSQDDDAPLELKAYMSSGLYRFVRECDSEGASVYRLFEYKNSARPYLLRLHTDPLVDPKTYIVVVSYLEPAGNYQHGIAEAGNAAAGLARCPPDAR